MVTIKIETKDEPSEQGEKCNSIIVSWDRGEKKLEIQKSKVPNFPLSYARCAIYESRIFNRDRF